MNLIIGESSMIGTHLGKILTEHIDINHSEYDLMTYKTCKTAFEKVGADKETVVYNLVGMNGGLIYNCKYPADIYYQSAQLNLNVLTCCKDFKVDRVISLISACSYPDKGCELEEEDLLNGCPNDTVSCHGFAKRTILEYSQQLYKQHKFKSISAVLTNSYGPYDRFNLERSKVVGAAVKKICLAKLAGDNSITFFGTGTPIRELMYAGDAARALTSIVDTYTDYMNPINIGSGQLISIYTLVNTIAELVGFEGEILWDKSKPDGQMLRRLSIKKMKEYVNFDMTPLRVGLTETINYFMSTGRFLER